LLGGVQLDLIAAPDHVDQLRAESRERAQKFPFAGATVTIAAKRRRDPGLESLRARKIVHVQAAGRRVRGQR
jgi:hypothetical protein